MKSLKEYLNENVQLNESASIFVIHKRNTPTDDFDFVGCVSVRKQQSIIKTLTSLPKDIDASEVASALEKDSVYRKGWFSIAIQKTTVY